jgi:hypothetical protein
MAGELTYIVTVQLNENYIKRKKFTNDEVQQAAVAHLADALRYDERYASFTIVPGIPETLSPGITVIAERCADCGCAQHDGICPECGHRHSTLENAEPVEKKFEPVSPDVILPAPNQWQDNYTIDACKFCRLTLPCRPISEIRGGKICKPCYEKRNDL